MSNNTNHICEAIDGIKSEIGAQVTLVAVSKTKPNEDIMVAYEGGQRIFGENKVQELVAKYEALPKDIEWHMIGHLQSNKVKYIAPFVHLIHGVDSPKLLKEINKQAAKNNRIVRCLLQLKIAKEDTKFGMAPEEALEIVMHAGDFPNVDIVGVMGMATFTDDEEVVRDEFQRLKKRFDSLKSNFESEAFNTISMGMSGDYKIAVEEGSTMVRIGSTIFGARNYE